MNIKTLWKIIKESISRFLAKGMFTRAAALSYYTIFSLPPMLLIILHTTTLIYQEETVRQTIFGQISEWIGQESAEQLSRTVDTIGIFDQVSWAAIIGMVGMLVSSTTVFVTIQDSLNRIFGVKEEPSQAGWWMLLRKRLLSFSLLLAIAFILLVSLIVNALLSFLFNYLENIVPEISTIFILLISVLVPLLATLVLFALIFKFLPDVKLPWKDCLRGGFVTTILFFIGMYGIEVYIGQSQTANLYQAAGSVLVILLWVFYASSIFLLGASFTATYIEITKGQIEPSKYAVRFRHELIKDTPPKEESNTDED